MINNLSSIWNNEVGAWTSAIHACGKCGRIDTAKKLFHVMHTKFRIKPNIITCGCLIDCLLKQQQQLLQNNNYKSSSKSSTSASTLSKNNDYTQDIVEVLKYMQSNGLEPTEVMYTSLISFAGRMVKLDTNPNISSSASSSSSSSSSSNKLQEQEHSASNGLLDDGDSNQKDTKNEKNKVMSVYIELMRSLVISGTQNDNDEKPPQDHDSLLLKVFLVFQEMKAAGAAPDM